MDNITTAVLIGAAFFIFIKMENKLAVQWSLSLFDENLEQNNASYEAQRLQLIEVIAHLIDTDYHRLTNILYRIDVDEMKLKKAILESELPISETIADLIIGRQQQKIKFREMYKKRNL